MPSAGALCPPLITPIRKPLPGLPAHHIDTTTLIELTSETTTCKFYFTTDGTKPSPFQRKVAGREITFKYVGPFTLKAGKRTLKAIAVSRDGLQESAVVSKNLIVDDVGTYVFDEDGISFGSDLEITKKPKTKKLKSNSTKSLTSKKLTTAKSLKNSTIKEAWGSKGAYDNYDSEALDRTPVIPDGPFNPTNYSGTQINVWGAPAGSLAGLNGGTLGTTSAASPYPTQFGFLTEQMIRGLNTDNNGVSVGDVRKSVKEEKPDIQEAPPAIEYPVYKNPPLNAVSVGHGDFKAQMLHIYAHMLDYGKTHTDFGLTISKPPLGKLLSADFSDEGDGYKITLMMGKPGVPPGSIRKKPKIEPKKKEVVKEKEKEKPKETKPKPAPVPKKSDPYFDMETENLNHEGTVKEYPNFNEEQDCEVLRNAMKGLGTDEESIINILAYRSNPQRQKIVIMYKTMFGKDLIEDLKSELSGSFLDTCKALCKAPAQFDANELRKAMKGLGTDDDVLIEILCTRSNAQIKKIIETYKELFNRNLEKDIISDTSGHFKRLLVGLVTANRSDGNKVDRNKAVQDAKALYQAGEKKWGTDESRFNAILVSRSYPQLRATFEEYGKLSKKDIEAVLKSELSGDLLRGMLTIVRCVRDKAGHFARQLQKTMKGIGTDDDTLVRVVVSRCETDMVQIKESFQSLTGQSLEQFLADDISGDYQKIILSLVTGGPPPEKSAKSGKAFVEATRAKTDEQLDEDVKMETENIQVDPTVKPIENFNAEQDAEALRKAMKGLGTDEQAIINVLGYRSTEQTLQISQTFKTMFGKDLIKELKSELSGSICDLCTGRCLSSPDFDAKQLNKAIKGLGTDEKVLVEVICTRTNQQIKDFKAAYKTMFQKDLEKDIAGDTSGHFKRILVALLQANREESSTFDRNKAKQDAQALFDAGEKKWGTDESRFNVVLVSRSYAQLRATFQEYAKISQKDIEEAIKSEMSGDIRDSMLTIVRCIRNKSTHFANELYKSMKGLGTDDDTLVRIMVSRCEVDMVQIKEEFQKNFKQTLAMFINDDVSGDAKKMCLALIGEQQAGGSKDEKAKKKGK